MADCNPPDPPPLLREPHRKLPTAEDRNAEDRARWEREQAAFWGDSYSHQFIQGGCGCLILMGVSFAGICWMGTNGPIETLPVLAALAELAFRGVPR